MIRKLLLIGIPTLVLALLGFGLWLGGYKEIIPPPVLSYLWPSLIALAFLVYAVVALLLRGRKWLWPLGAGFLTQCLGILLYALRAFESPWTILWYTLAVVGVVLLCMLIVWLVMYLRSRWLEKQMIQGLGGAGDAGAEDLPKIRENMMEALSLLRRAGGSRHAIYELPWFLVMGRSQAGKTVAIKNSGLGLPVRKDWVKGVGGTHTANWFFTKDLIFLDTPGRWVTEGADEATRKNWLELLRLLRKYRGRRPLDGLVVVLPADDLLSRPEDDLRDQASHVREIVDLLHHELQFRFPVYLLVSKADLVEGFTEFFRGIPAQRRHEILGWSHADPSTWIEPRRLVATAFRTTLKRLDAYRLEMVGRIASTTRARRLFFFPEEFRRLERGLQAFAEIFFVRDPSGDTPIFRGVYFTSGTQGEGSPIARAMGEFARSIGITAAKTGVAEGEPEPKRSYFLLDLFRDLLGRDQGLVSRTTLRGWHRQRNTALGIFLPSVLALTFLGFSSISFLLNRGLYRRIQTEVPPIMDQLDRVRAASMAGTITSGQLRGALGATEKLRDFHRKMTGFSLLRSFGMRRPGSLDEQVLGFYKNGFKGAILEPTLRAAQAFASDPQRTCLDRIDLMHSVVWLRMGRRSQWSNDLQGFGRLWQLSREETGVAADELLRQYGYLTEMSPREKTMLPGFSIETVARSIRVDCQRQGSTSTLARYHDFQESCRSAGTARQIKDCYAQLGEILRYKQQDYVKFLEHFQDLKNDLASLQGAESEAGTGLELLKQLDLSKVETGECLVEFADKVAPEIGVYADQEKMIQECQGAVALVKSRQEKIKKRDEIIQAQGDSRKEMEKSLVANFEHFSDKCRGSVTGFLKLDFPILKLTLDGYRQSACVSVRDVLVDQWTEMRTYYNKEIADRYPFSPSSAQAADPAALAGFFGGETGKLAEVLGSSTGEDLGAGAQAWVNRAENLSKVLFESGKDQPRKVGVTLTKGAPTYEPAELEKELKVSEVTLNLGQSGNFAWSEGEPETQHFSVDIFGESSGDSFSNVSAKVALRKGFMGRMLTKNWKEDKVITGASTAGAWAPIKLLLLGVPKNWDGRSDILLHYKIAIPGEKGELGKISLQYMAKGEEMARLLKLAQIGLPRPPEQPGGD